MEKIIKLQVLKKRHTIALYDTGAIKDIMYDSAFERGCY
jgi:hypothetical protein